MLEFISSLLDGAADILEKYRGRMTGGDIGFKSRRDLITVADSESERYIVERIRERFPDDSIYAEEEERQTRDPSRWWFVDPLDGTINFAHNLPMYGISVALWERGDMRYGGIYAPALEEKYLAEAGQGAYKNGTRIHVSDTTELADALVATGFSYNRLELTNNNVEALAYYLMRCRCIRRAGAASLDLAWLAAGKLDAFWEAYLGPWDVAAGLVLIREAGGRVSDYQGGEDYLFGENFVASNGRLHDEFAGNLPPLDPGTATRFTPPEMR